MLTIDAVWRGLAGLLVLGAVAGGAAAQEPEACPAGSFAVGEIGYEEMKCNCSFSVSDEGPDRFLYSFRSEPTLGKIKSGGPADGKLREGDVITAIDGHLITTREGGRRFANLEPGRPVVLTVRRGEREIDVTITPRLDCLEISFAPPPPKAPRPVREPRGADVPRPPYPVGEPPSPPSPAQALPRGRLGFSFTCSDCSVQILESVEHPVWSFSSPPAVERVERYGPAREAGILAGDILTHINELPLTTADGGRLFGAIEAGDTVRFRLLRNNEVHDVQLVAEERMALREAVPIPSPVKEPLEETVRFTGQIGDAMIQVTGGPITVNRTETEIVIRSQDIVVRIRKATGEGT